jgi:hypothetical protein
MTQISINPEKQEVFLLSLNGHVGHDRHAITKLSQNRGDMTKDQVLNLNLDHWQQNDFLSLKRILISISSILLERNFSILKIQGIPLIIPGNRQENIPLELLDSFIQHNTGKLRKKYFVIPLAPHFLDFYLSRSHFHKGQSHKIFDLANILGYNCVGVIEKESEFLATYSDIITTAMEDLGETKNLYWNYISLFSHLHSIMDVSGNHLPRNRDKHLPAADAQSILKSKLNSIQYGHLALKVPMIRSLMSDIETSGSFNDLERVELLLVACGKKKSMRTSIKKNNFRMIEPLLSKYGLYHRLDQEPNRCYIDHGKGGWSNIYDPKKVPFKKNKELLLYIGTSRSNADNAADAEIKDDERFGEALSYPDCCRSAFERNFQIAIKKQGDLVPLVADQTLDPGPWPFLLNTPARYFLRQVISFYPCSYTCSEALNLAKGYYAVIKEYLPELAIAMKSMMASPILYTEYRGIYLFEHARIIENKLQYEGSNVHMTTDNSLGKIIRLSDGLFVHAPDEVEFFNGHESLKILKGNNIRMMLFDDRDLDD